MNREAFEAWYSGYYTHTKLDRHEQGHYIEPHAQNEWHCWQAALASQAQQESQALKALKGMIELWFRTRESGCLPIEVAHAQFVLKNILPPSPEGDKS